MGKGKNNVKMNVLRNISNASERNVADVLKN